MKSHSKNVEMMHRIFNRSKVGDKVHAIAHPIAKAIDKTVGTNISKCGACAKRREKLNNLFNKDT